MQNTSKEKYQQLKMEKMIIDERTGWKYELVGDYYLPVEMPMDKALERMPERQARQAAAAMTAILEVDAQVPAEEKTTCRIGRFGRAHAAYLKRNQLNVFSQLAAKAASAATWPSLTSRPIPCWSS